MIDARTEALRAALDRTETDLEFQVRLLAGTAGEYARNMLISVADQVLIRHLWPALKLRPAQEPILRDLIGDAEVGELSIRLIAGQSSTLWLSLSRMVCGWVEYLRNVRIPLYNALWAQIREA
jgi:hypothetical protein